MTLSSEMSGSDLEPIPGLQVQLFGPPTVLVEGDPLPPLHTRNCLWLLALLVLKHPRPVDRVLLAEALWPDSDPTASRKNLRNRLTELRHALGSQGIRIQSPTSTTLRLDLAMAEVDLTDFDASVERGDQASLTEAIALYRGPLLEGCNEDWVLEERRTRDRSCLEALERLADFELQAGQAAQAALHLHACIGMDPFRETAQCALMIAMAAISDFAGVTHVYQKFRLQLHEQLQTQPAAETTALYQMIRVRARQVAAGGTAPLPVPSLPRRRTDTSALPLEESEATSDDIQHNLPPALTSFIGREKECADIQELLEQTRLLTLTGTGGSGKTRLALQVAGERVASYTDGVRLVELAALSDPARVVQTVATAFDIREQPNVPLLQTLVSALQTKTLLLLLDNCEHLLAACGELAVALLHGCPSVRLLATSRERLGIAGEQMYRVPSLSLPDLNMALSVESVLRYESVQLFEARARLIRSDFRVSAQNARAVAQVCHRLDGIPLAIELAAACMRAMSLDDIEKRLDSRFRLLKGGNTAALPRQQTLKALIDWSYELLDEQEQALLRRLSVFAGGWTLEAAEAVYADPLRPDAVREAETLPILADCDVLDLLFSLVDKSLVEHQDGKGRYRLLETVREYGRDRLGEKEEIAEVHALHRGYFLTLAEQAEPHLKGAEQAVWLERLQTDHDNLLAAVDWSLKEDEASAPLRFCGAMSPFWCQRSYFTEGRARCQKALDKTGAHKPKLARAKVLDGAGTSACCQGDYTAANAYFEESRAICKEIGDRHGEANALSGLGNVAFSLSNYVVARGHHNDSRAIYKEIGDCSGEARSLNNLGNVDCMEGDLAAARTCFELSLATFREIGDRSSEASLLNNLGHVARSQGDYTAANTYFEESRTFHNEIGDRYGEANALCNLGIAAYYKGDYTVAESYFKQNLLLSKHIGSKDGIARALNGLGNIATAQGGYIKAQADLEESLTISTAIEDRVGIALVLNGLGNLFKHQGDEVKAQTNFEASLALARQVGDQETIGVVLNNLGNLATDQSDYETARKYLQESLEIFQKLRHPRGIAHSLEGFAALAALADRMQQAGALWGAAEAWRETARLPVPPDLHESYHRAVADVQEALGEQAFRAAWAKGRGLKLEQAIAFALEVKEVQ